MASSGVVSGTPAFLSAPGGVRAYPFSVLANNSGQSQSIMTVPGGQEVRTEYGDSAHLKYLVSQVWSPTVDYTQFPALMVIYGTNSAPAGSYPNNIYFPSGPAVAVVGVPPSNVSTGGGAANPGWILASTWGGGAPQINSSGFTFLERFVYGGNAPAYLELFGGGRPSVGSDTPTGLTLEQSDTSTAAGNNGAQLIVSGQVKADAFSYLPTDQSLGPASSVPNGTGSYSGITSDSLPFSLGKNYSWVVNPAPSANGGYWWNAVAGTGGTSVVTCPACSPGAMIFCQRELDLGTAAGTLAVSAKTTTSFTLTSRDSANAVVAADTAFYNFQIMNPDWST
jgi:hypothetical protein